MKISTRKKAEPQPEPEPESVPFKMHPRVFQALGSELVTSDIVAIIELVKNSYDAFATKVDVRFGLDEEGEPCLDINDDGLGMTRSTIEEVWCTVATPFRERNPQSRKDGKVRRTTGAKGLGRLSAARLGSRMQMITRARGNKGWQVDVDWSALPTAKKIDACYALLLPVGLDILPEGGTNIRIYGLQAEWDDEEIKNLEENLARLSSPFEQIANFDIFLTPPGLEAAPTKIRPSEFLKHPPYMLKGGFTKDGEINYDYVFKPWTGKGRRNKQTVTWATVQFDINRTLDKPLPPKDEPRCGPFTFEIRIWDLDTDSLGEAQMRFNLRRSMLRAQIRAFKGLSLYRDSVLVLPKSDNNRDWLGLDLRRVSKVGSRLSTTQMVGYVAISADSNPELEDTSDRERLVRNEATILFEQILRYIVSLLEFERDRDHEKAEPKLRDLFQELSPRKLIDDVEELAAENASAREVLPLIAKYSRAVEQAKSQLERQIVFYNRLATVGTIAQMLVHEVGNNTVVLDAFVRCVKDWLSGTLAKRAVLDQRMKLAEGAIDTLTTLADRFRPLANRAFDSGKHTASLNEAVKGCLQALAERMKQLRITVETKLKGPDSLKISAGELYSIIYNLLDNATYWLGQRKESRTIEITSSRAAKSGYCVITVSDSGPGVSEDDQKMIFYPGVTRRPNGFGMGLTVVGDIVEGAGGSIGLTNPGTLNGATFVLELPVAD